MSTIRVVIAKPGLDGHDRGAKVIARALRDAGMEVIYTGLRQTPEQIVAAALQEDADVIGLSILSGAHMHICPRVMELLKEKGLSHVRVLVGGIIPDVDIAKLRAMGVTGIFLPGTPMQDIVNFINTQVPPRAEVILITTMATLLLADDSVTIQRVIELTFANESIRVVTAPDGHAATAMLEAERPDIVLADVGLPAVDGYTLAERLKRHQATATIPVLLLTGAFEPIDEARARRTGCDGVLVKPFEPHRVVSLVKMLLAGQTPDNLWPSDMPRIDSGEQSSAPEPASARPHVARRESVGEPGTMPPPSAIEEVFEIGLDDLDLAFSRLDPVAAPSRIDADSVSDFQRDIEELRSVSHEPVSLSPVPPRPTVSEAVTEGVPLRPVEDRAPIDIDGLDWDLPTSPAARIDAPQSPTPLPAEAWSFAPTPPPPPPVNVPVLSTPWTPPPPVAAPVEVPPPPPPPPSVVPPPPQVVLPPPVEIPPAPPAPPPPPPAPAPVPAPPAPLPALPTELFAPVVEPPPAPVAPPAPAPEPAPQVTPPTLAAAFSALLAAEQSQPASAKPVVTELSSSDAMVEAVVRRVAARLTGEVDRLVREELERLKR